MEQKNYLYSSGDFAKLVGVNKRTLHYYNDIGLFCPKEIGENGYHYYTCFQFAELELILTLRKIGLSIDEIREYVTKISKKTIASTMQKQKEMIEASIRQLVVAQDFLERKMERLKLGTEAKHGVIRVCTLPERKIICSAPISGKYDEGDFAVAAEFSLRLKKQFHLYDSFGSRISIDAINQGKMRNYDSFFAYCPSCSEDVYDEILPEGIYLQAFCVGEWGTLPEMYQSILSYAREHRLTPTGYAYEEGLNELAIQNQKDYVTMISVLCEGACI